MNAPYRAAAERPVFCRNCGAPGMSFMVDGDDGEPRECHGCLDCMKEIAGRFDAVRPIHQAMLAAGVPDGIANDVMGELLGRIDAANAWPLRRPS